MTIKRRPGTQFIRELSGEEAKILDEGGKFTLTDGQITLTAGAGVLIGQRFSSNDIEALNNLSSSLESIVKK